MFFSAMFLLFSEKNVFCSDSLSLHHLFSAYMQQKAVASFHAQLFSHHIELIVEYLREQRSQVPNFL